MTAPGTPGPDAVQRLYTRRARSYTASVQVFGHRQGLRTVLTRVGVLGQGQRILDAGCGTGLSILALAEATRRAGPRPECVHAFDLTPAMLERCQATLSRHLDGGQRVRMPRPELRQADVLRLDEQLPASWRGYNLIVCASMLEHLPRNLLRPALAALSSRLAPGGRLLIVATRSSFYPTRWIWHCQGYSRRQLRSAFADAALTRITPHHYPWNYAWLNIADHIITGRASS